VSEQLGDVLVIDDDDRMCETLGAVLRHAGYAVRTASRGQEGLAQLRSAPVDIAIVDINLPDGSGLDLLADITRVSPDAEVIFISGFAPFTSVIEALGGAAFAYLPKPFEMPHLLAIVRKAREKQTLVRALGESEDRYRLVTEHILDALYLFDVDGNITFVNRRAEELSGYSRDELLGRQISTFLAPDSARRPNERIEVAREGRAIPSSFERELVRKDGTHVWVEGHTTSISRDGKLIGRLGAARDISQRMVVEAARRESEERFRAVFEQAAVGIGVVADDGRFLRVNQRLCDMVGYTADELTSMRFLDITYPEDREMNVALRRPMIDGTAPAYSIEKRYVRKDGGVIWVAVTASQATEPSGRRYSIGIIQDITERKRLEQQLLHAQRMEGIGQLAGGIAHDFNNLLTVISGRSELVFDSLAPADPARRDLDLIHATAERAAALTRQLLAFSRKQVLQPKVIALSVLVASATNLLKRILGENIELTFASDPDPGWVLVDPGQIEQVIVNLAVNARDAMPGGGRLTLETANVELDRAYAAHRVDVAPGRYVRLVVSDTGAGMSAALQAHIFEPFFTTKGPGKGTGLGLATAYGIVKQSGGHISVYSEPGVGTTFKIDLPRTDEVREAPAPASAPALSHGTETILLVEDEAEVRDLSREILARLGYTLLEAAMPRDALLVAQRHVGRIDLLLTDVVMPQMSGRALAEAVVSERPEMKVLFMSGYTDDAIIRHGVLEPGISFIEKPFAPRALAAKIREVLDRPQ
jgi:PAS domain S-box-containing protein